MKICSPASVLTPSPVESTRALSYGLSNPGSEKLYNPREPVIRGIAFSLWDPGTKLSMFQDDWRKNHPPSPSDSVGSGYEGLDQGAKRGAQWAQC
jgi:hypothetical protein